MNFRYSTTLQIVLGLCVALFLGANPAKANVTEYFDYSNGSLATVSNNLWSTTGLSLQVISEEVKATTTSQYNTYNLEAKEYVYTHIKRKTTAGATASFMQFWNSDNQISTGFYNYQTELKAYGGTSLYTGVSNSSYTEYTMIVNCENDTYTIRANDANEITNNLYTPCTTISKISIGNDAGSTATAYFDDFIEVNFSELVDDEQWQTNVNLFQVSAGIEFPSYLKCFPNEDCMLPYMYGSDMVGGKLFLIKEENYQLPIWDASQIDYASTTLTNTLIMKGTFNVTATSTGEQEFCYYWQEESGTISENDLTACNIHVIYAEDPEIDRLLGLIDCNCDDIATSSEWYEGFTNGVNCGFRQATCWALKPSKSSINQFSNAVNDFNNVFPLTIYNQVDTEIKSLENSTSTMNITLDGFFPGDNSQYVVLTPTTLQTKLGTVWTTLYATMEYIFYFLTFLYFVNYIFSHKSKETPT